MKKVKKVVSVFVAIVLIFSIFQIVSFADTASTMNTIISGSECYLIISGINSTSKAVLRTSSTTSLSIKMELQKLKNGTYTTVETWTSSKNGMELSLEKTRLINALSTYRLAVTFKAGNETQLKFAY